MNAVMEAIVSRRSVRAFEKKELPAEALEEILKAATYAPSGKNQQTWQFTVVKSREKIKQLAGLVETELNRPGYNMYEPEVIIIPSNDRESPFGMEDNACAMENIFLAAWSFGIGSGPQPADCVGRPGKSCGVRHRRPRLSGPGPGKRSA